MKLSSIIFVLGTSFSFLISAGVSSDEHARYERAQRQQLVDGSYPASLMPLALQSPQPAFSIKKRLMYGAGAIGLLGTAALLLSCENSSFHKEIFDLKALTNVSLLGGLGLGLNALYNREFKIPEIYFLSFCMLAVGSLMPKKTPALTLTRSSILTGAIISLGYFFIEGY